VKSHRPAALAAVGALSLCAAAVALAATSAPTVTVVANNLNNPRGVFAAADGSVYVAESGKAGPTCLDKQKSTCVGFSGSIARFNAGKVVRIATGLLSIGGQDGSFTVGADGVAVDESGAVYVQQTAAPECMTPKGVPPQVTAQLGKTLRVVGGKLRPVAWISPLECKHNYDHTDRNSDPYAIVALGGDHEVVVDAGANALFDVRPSGVKLLAVFPKTALGAQSVPTSIAVGSDGAYYVGEFVGEPPKGKKPAKNQARVWKVEPGKKPVVFAKGFNAITGVAFDQDGNLFVTEFSVDPTNQNNAKGDVVKVGTDGSHTRIGLGKLFFPAGAAVAQDGAVYVSNWSILPGTAAKGGPFKGKSGQLVRITNA